MCEMKKTVEAINGKLDTAEQKITVLEDTAIGSIQMKRDWKNWQSFSELRDNFKEPIICVSGIFNGQRIRREEEEIMNKKIPRFDENYNLQIQEA